MLGIVKDKFSQRKQQEFNLSFFYCALAIKFREKKENKQSTNEQFLIEVFLFLIFLLRIINEIEELVIMPAKKQHVFLLLLLKGQHRPFLE